VSNFYSISSSDFHRRHHQKLGQFHKYFLTLATTSYNTANVFFSPSRRNEFTSEKILMGRHPRGSCLPAGRRAHTLEAERAKPLIFVSLQWPVANVIKLFTTANYDFS
jgi:hypothetical protein